jgi:hypothetical protein
MKAVTDRTSSDHVRIGFGRLDEDLRSRHHATLLSSIFSMIITCAICSKYKRLLRSLL